MNKPLLSDDELFGEAVTPEVTPRSALPAPKHLNDFVLGTELISDNELFGEPPSVRADAGRGPAWEETGRSNPGSVSDQAAVSAIRNGTGYIPDGQPGNPEGTAVGRALERGWIGLTMTPDALALRKAEGLLDQATKGPGTTGGYNTQADQLEADAAAYEEALPALEAADPEQAAFLREEIASLRKKAELARAMAEGASATGAQERAKAEFDAFLPDAAKAAISLAEKGRKRSELPFSATSEDFQKELAGVPDTFWDTMSVLARNPLGGAAFLGEVVVEGAPAIGGAAAAAAVTRNPTLAAGILAGGSAAQEYGLSVNEFLDENGVKLETPDDAAALLNDPKLLAEANERGLGRALAIAAFEMIGQGIAGRVASGVKGAVADTAAQGATGAGGEAAARAVTGQEMSAKEITIEGLAEGVTAPAEIAIAAAEGKPSNAAEAAEIEKAWKPVESGPTKVGAAPLEADASAALTEQTTPTPGHAAAATEVTPEQAAALKGKAVDIVAAGRKKKEDEKKASGKPETAPVTPSGSAGSSAPAAEGTTSPKPSPEAAGDTIETVPEAPATLDAQNAALLDPKDKRKAVFIPNSSYEAGTAVEPEGRTVGKLVVDEGVIFFNKAKGYTLNDVRALHKSGRLGTVLGLGEYTKADVANSAAAGSPEVAVTERTPEGVEVKAAAGTTETAPEQAADLEEEKSEGNTVQVESPAKVLLDRINALQAARVAPPAKPEVTPEVTPEGNAPMSAAAQALADIEAASLPPPTKPAPTKPAPTKTPKVAAAVEKAKKAAAQAAPKPEPKPEPRVEQELVFEDGTKSRVEVDPETGKRRVIRTSAETEAATEEFNAGVTARAAEDNKAEKAKAVSEKRAGKRAAKMEEIETKAREGKFESAADEAEARARAGGRNLMRAEVGQARTDGRVAAELLESAPEEYTPVTDKGGRAALQDRLATTIASATDKGFKFLKKSTYDTNTDAYVWLHDAKMMLGKLRSGKATKDEIDAFLIDEQAVRRGEGELLRKRRLARGTEIKGGNKGDGNVDAIAEITSSDPDEEEGFSETSLDDANKDEPEAKNPAADTASAADDADKGAAMTPNKRRAASLESAADEDIYAKELEKQGLTPREWRQLNDEDPARAKEVMEKAKKASVRSVSDEDRAAAEKYATPLTPEQLEKFRKNKAEKTKAVSKARDKTVHRQVDPSAARLELIKKVAAKRARTKMEQELTDAIVAETTVGGLGPTFLRGHIQRFFNEVIIPALGDVRANAYRKLFRHFHDTIVGLTKDTKVVFVEDSAFAEYDASMGGDGATTMGFYLDRTDTIVFPESVVDRVDFYHILLHEMAHAASVHAMKQNPKLLRQLGALRMAVEKAHPSLSKTYGLTDAFEFFSELISNPDFQQLLAATPLTDTARERLRQNGWSRVIVSHLGSVWDAIKTLIGEALGIPGLLADAGVGSDTVLAAALETVEAILGKSEQARRFAARNLDSDMKNDFSATFDVTGDRSTGPRADGSFNAVFRAKHQEGLLSNKKRDPINIRDRLVKAGLPPKLAAEVAEELRQAYGNTLTTKEVNEVAKQLKKAVTSLGNVAAAPAASVQEEVKAAEQAAVKRVERIVSAPDFVPAKNPGSLGKLLGAMRLTHISAVSDRWFGENNPVRAIEKIWNSRPTIKKARRAKMEVHIRSLHELRKTLKREGKSAQFDEFVDLLIAARTANVHPDVALSDPKNAHMGKDNHLAGTWGRAQHGELAQRWRAMDPRLQAEWHSVLKMYSDAQNEMSRTLIRQTMLAVGIEDAALADRFFDGTETEADVELVTPTVAIHIKRAAQMTKVAGPYVDLARRGNWVVSAVTKANGLDANGNPAGGHAVKGNPEGNKFEFTAPNGAKSPARGAAEARKAAKAFAALQDTDTKITTEWYDTKTGLTYGVEDDGTEVRIPGKDTDAARRFVVTVQTEHVEHTDSRAEARRKARDLEAAGYKVKDISEKSFERRNANADIKSDQLRAIAETMDKHASTSKLTPRQQEELKNALHEISLRWLGSTRIQSHRLPARFVQGASRDVLRNMFEYADSTAGYLTKMDTQADMDAALKSLDSEVKRLRALGVGKGGEGAKAIQNEIEKRVLDPKFDIADGMLAKWADRLAGSMFMRHLLSPAYTFINLTQPILWTAPTLIARYGEVKGTAAMIKAYATLTNVITLWHGSLDTFKGIVGIKNRDYMEGVLRRLKDPDERQFIADLMADGTIDVDAGLEIANEIQDRSGIGGAVDALLDYMGGIARALPSAAEAINRTVTALAAYRLELAKSGDRNKASVAARDMVNDTQSRYSQSDQPAIFQSAPGRLLLQFKKFGHGAYYMLGKQLAGIFRGQNKLRSAKTLTYILATHMLFAGISGLPWEPARIAAAFAKGAGITLYSWEDAQDAVEGMIAKSTDSEAMAEAAMYGLPRLVGVDISSRVGLDSLLTFGEPRSGKENDIKAYFYNLVSGPSGDYLSDVLTGIGAMADGQYGKAARSLVPAKIITDSVKAYQGYTSGEMSGPSAALQVAGLRSAEQARASDQKGAEIRAKSREQATRFGLMDDYVAARDMATITKLKGKIREFNASLPKDSRSRISIENLEEKRREGFKK